MSVLLYQKYALRPVMSLVFFQDDCVISNTFQLQWASVSIANWQSTGESITRTQQGSIFSMTTWTHGIVQAVRSHRKPALQVTTRTHGIGATVFAQMGHTRILRIKGGVSLVPKDGIVP